MLAGICTNESLVSQLEIHQGWLASLFRFVVAVFLSHSLICHFGMLKLQCPSQMKLELCHPETIVCVQ